MKNAFDLDLQITSCEGTTPQHGHTRHCHTGHCHSNHCHSNHCGGGGGGHSRGC